MAASTLRFGTGVTREVGMDMSNLINKLPANERANAKIAVFTDPNIAKLPIMETVEQALQKEGHNFVVFQNVAVEPTENSWTEAIEWTRGQNPTHFLAVGGGSTMDTAKAANLLSCYPDKDMYEFINAPIGKGTPIAKTLKPLVAVPTTAGTGSETTGTAILDIPAKKFKTGIASRALKPTLGIVDTNNTATCPREVAVAAGLDVLFHSLESYTAIPYWERTPRPSNPIQRPAYQGSNPLSDIFSKWALEQTIKYLPRIFKDPHGDEEARTQMLLASSTAGIGFGNAGVHLCVSPRIRRYLNTEFRITDTLLARRFVPHLVAQQGSRQGGPVLPPLVQPGCSSDPPRCCRLPHRARRLRLHRAYFGRAPPHCPRDLPRQGGCPQGRRRQGRRPRRCSP